MRRLFYLHTLHCESEDVIRSFLCPKGDQGCIHRFQIFGFNADRRSHQHDMLPTPPSHVPNPPDAQTAFDLIPSRPFMRDIWCSRHQDCRHRISSSHLDYLLTPFRERLSSSPSFSQGLHILGRFDKARRNQDELSGHSARSG